jgi:hypothetical protein
MTWVALDIMTRLACSRAHYPSSHLVQAVGACAALIYIVHSLRPLEQPAAQMMGHHACSIQSIVLLVHVWYGFDCCDSCRLRLHEFKLWGLVISVLLSGSHHTAAVSLLMSSCNPVGVLPSLVINRLQTTATPHINAAQSVTAPWLPPGGRGLACTK